ncbi:uncharacterized protein LOC124158696 [Ischnura elegans]|uniref:uncharacterized protein LOC124158696 n=1 Tax=Ischnura elegans TaxID=197161 RepID=UPI001ED8BE3F|nr:uncharacterized protein LOC124158696 [Ischnura elegans]
MPKGVKSRKFISPLPKEDKKRKFESSDDGDAKDSGSPEGIKSKACVSRSMSDSQYDVLFSSVLGHTETNVRGKQGKDHRVIENTEEDNVAVPEPNAALSPAESAEEGSSETTGSAVKTPDQRIDNSVLPPVKRKKPSSKIARLKLKIKPTRLNFDDPALLGESDNLPKPQKSKPLPSKTSQTPKTSSKPSDCKELQKRYQADSKKKSCPKTPDTRESLQNESWTPTGRVIDDSQLSTGSIGRGASLQTPMSSQLLCSQTSSIQAAVLSPRSKLFRLHRKRNVGLWVQCTNQNCNKWRYLPSTRDPTEVPDNWKCFMNHDKKYGSCSAPEKGPTPVEEEDLIHNLYTAGSLVWGHLAGYPWWPAMVDDDPDVEQYYWITENSDIPTHYNVTFFDEKPVTRAWLTPGAMTKFSQPECHKDVFNKTARGLDYRRRLEVAKSQAEDALKLPVDERLKKYSFPARYKGPIGKKRYPSDSEDDEVNQKSIKRVPKKPKAVSEEDPMKDIMESLEVVKEVNEVLDELMSDSGSDNEEKSEKRNSSVQNPGKEMKKGKLSLPCKDKGKQCNSKNKHQKSSKDSKGVDEVDGVEKNLKNTVSLTTEVKKKKKPKKGENEAINKEMCTEDNEENKKDSNRSQVTVKKTNQKKEMKKSKKNDEAVSKEINKSGDNKAKKDEKKKDKTPQEKSGKGETKSKQKQTKASDKAEEAVALYEELLSRNNLNEDKQKKKIQLKDIAAINIVDDDAKTEEQADGEDQMTKSNSEAIRDEDFYVPSSTGNLTSAPHVAAENSNECESDNGSHTSDVEDSADVEGDDSESGGSDGKEGDETSSTEQESDSDSNPKSEEEESNPKQSPKEIDSSGRHSADLFDPEQCNPELPTSQLSADFEVEE